MRIAVSAEQNSGLTSPVSGHFGRCPCFVIVEVEQKNPVGVMVVSNPFYDQHRPGQVPAFIRQQGADVLISGGMGGRAVGFFQEYGIEPVTGAYGTVEEAVRAYLAGELVGAAPCRESVEHGHGHVHEPGSGPEGGGEGAHEHGHGPGHGHGRGRRGGGGRKGGFRP